MSNPSPPTLFGIENCDQVRKAKAWLNKAPIQVNFHDFRKHGLDENTLSNWLSHVPWDSVLNKRGTTWRQLSAEQKASVTDQPSAVSLMLANPTLIKRPILVDGQAVLVGFSEAVYAKHFGQ